MVSLVFADSNLPLPFHEWGWKGDWVITPSIIIANATGLLFLYLNRY